MIYNSHGSNDVASAVGPWSVVCSSVALPHSLGHQAGCLWLQVSYLVWGANSMDTISCGKAFEISSVFGLP